MKQSILKMNCAGKALIMVEVKIWSKIDNIFRKMHLTVDTGASITTISRDLIHCLGYEPNTRSGIMIATASGIEYADELIVNKIQIGEFILEDVKIYCHAFPEESFSLGVLGLNILEKFDINLMFSKRLIIFKERT